VLIENSKGRWSDAGGQTIHVQENTKVPILKEM